jgi:hypothetical protein
LEGYLQSEVLEEALRAVLEDEVDVLGVVEEAVELEHVGVVHVHLQLDLPEDLILHLCLLYLGLVHHLYREDVLGRSLLGQVHVAESAAAELLSQLEVIYR